MSRNLNTAAAAVDKALAQLEQATSVFITLADASHAAETGDAGSRLPRPRMGKYDQAKAFVSAAASGAIARGAAVARGQDHRAVPSIAAQFPQADPVPAAPRPQRKASDIAIEVAAGRMSEKQARSLARRGHVDDDRAAVRRRAKQ